MYYVKIRINIHFRSNRLVELEIFQISAFSIRSIFENPTNRQTRHEIVARNATTLSNASIEIIRENSIPLGGDELESATDI